MIKQILTLVFVSLFFTNCSENKSSNINYVLKKNNTNTCGIEVPDFMKSASNLNEQASLQYQNLFKELYVIIIDEKKDEVNPVLTEFDYEPSIKGYIDLSLDGVKDYMIKVDKTKKIKSFKSGNIKHHIYQIEGQVENLDVCYLFNYAESNGSYYQVMAWTLKNKKDKHFETMEKMVMSLKELN